MKKLLVVPIMLVHFLIMLILFPVAVLLIVIRESAEWLSNVSNGAYIYIDDYIMTPFSRMYGYALRIMRSDSIIKWINEASDKLKHGEPIDNNK